VNLPAEITEAIDELVLAADATRADTFSSAAAQRFTDARMSLKAAILRYCDAGDFDAREDEAILAALDDDSLD
jgi:hypothetical protein